MFSSGVETGDVAGVASLPGLQPGGDKPMNLQLTLQREHQAFQGAGEDHDMVPLLLVLPEAAPARRAELGPDQFLVAFPGQPLNGAGRPSRQVGLVAVTVLPLEKQMFDKSQGPARRDEASPEQKKEKEPFRGQADQGSIHIEDGGNLAHPGLMGWLQAFNYQQSACSRNR